LQQRSTIAEPAGGCAFDDTTTTSIKLQARAGWWWQLLNNSICTYVWVTTYRCSLMSLKSSWKQTLSL